MQHLSIKVDGRNLFTTLSKWVNAAVPYSVTPFCGRRVSGDRNALERLRCWFGI